MWMLTISNQINTTKELCQAYDQMIRDGQGDAVSLTLNMNDHTQESFLFKCGYKLNPHYNIGFSLFSLETENQTYIMKNYDQIQYANFKMGNIATYLCNNFEE